MRLRALARRAFFAPVTKPHKAVRSARLGRKPVHLLYIARMPAPLPSADRPRSLTRRLALLIAVVLRARAGGREKAARACARRIEF